jgi:hypothetical protein
MPLNCKSSVKEFSCLGADATPLPFTAISELRSLPLIIIELGAPVDVFDDESIENASSWGAGGKFKSKMLRSERGFEFDFDIKSKPCDSGSVAAGGTVTGGSGASNSESKLSNKLTELLAGVTAMDSGA